MNIEVNLCNWDSLFLGIMMADFDEEDGSAGKMLSFGFIIFEVNFLMYD